MSIAETILERIVFIDGAMGTFLQENGLKTGELPESMNISSPELITKIHRAYLDAGCDIITANTFGANRIKLEGTGFTVESVVSAALQNAKAALESTNTSSKRYIALDVGSTGKLLEPFGELTFEEAYDVYKEQITAGEAYGADLVIIETMTDTYEMKAAVLAVKENTSLPVFTTFSFDEKGKLLTGADIACAVALLEGLGVDALGINCGLGPKKMKKFLHQLCELSSLPVIIMPNAGMPVMQNGRTVFEVEPDDFAADMLEMALGGAQIIGGCCGTTPAHLQKTIEFCKGIKPKPVTNKNITVVSSYSKTCVIGEKPVIIGERINPTGKKKFKEALLKGDYDYIVEQGIEQQEAGANILDVNVGMPGINESDALVRTVKDLQMSLTLPLQIDSADPDAIEKSLRIYNGKALINSVNGKEEDMKNIFPLAKKYGGVLVALTLDEDGIPDTAQGRLAIARRIINTAAQYGIEKKNIIVDALTMTVGASADAAKITLDSLALIKKELGVKTVLGVSNVSFGLPQRDVINATFFAEALCRGLDVGIINPSSDAMMNTYYSHNALNGLDYLCLEYGNYIEALTEQVAVVTTVEKQTSLYAAIKGGLAQRTYELTMAELKNSEPQKVVAGILVPALDEVGKGFENKTLFLPQLIKSAEAAQNAFAAIKEKLSLTGEVHKVKGKILLATVKGDIHDIGKNIAKVMLENYGYEVVDLGRNVDCELIAATAAEQNIKLVGLSALMTTTVPAMENIIKLIKSKTNDCKIMVGGAVVTAEYAKQINADFYAADAMNGVSIADEIFA
jgi:5-methyltetrahydrofolate--homocysteine methyltransferase